MYLYCGILLLMPAYFLQAGDNDKYVLVQGNNGPIKLRKLVVPVLKIQPRTVVPLNNGQYMLKDYQLVVVQSNDYKTLNNLLTVRALTHPLKLANDNNSDTDHCNVKEPLIVNPQQDKQNWRSRVWAWICSCKKKPIKYTVCT